MRYYYDLHIHSVLSACAESFQTPNNILNMCMLKGLDVISISDHNSAKQYEAIDEIKSSYDFNVIYGMEVNVNEGFHVLTYFADHKSIMALSDVIEKDLDKSVISKTPQVITDCYDEKTSEVEYFLNQRTKMNFCELIEFVHKMGGLVIPAHIERKSGILNVYQNLNDFEIDGVEIDYKENLEDILIKFPVVANYPHIFNSDSHSLELISERENYFEAEEKSFSGFKKWLKEKL